MSRRVLATRTKAEAPPLVHQVLRSLDTGTGNVTLGVAIVNSKF